MNHMTDVMMDTDGWIAFQFMDDGFYDGSYDGPNDGLCNKFPPH